MSIKNLQVALNAKDCAELGRKHGMHFDEEQVALIELTALPDAVAFLATQVGEPGYFVNVVAVSEEGEVSQWQGKDGEMTFGEALDVLLSVSSMSTGKLVSWLASAERIA